MHELFLWVYEIAESEDVDLEDPAVYASIMSKPLLKLRATSQEEKTVIGLNFWRIGTKGAAAGFSSGAGKNDLLGLLSKNLPQSGDLWTRDIAKFRKYDPAEDQEPPRLWWK